MRSVSTAGRIAAIGAVVVAIVIVAVLLFAGGSGNYTVTAHFLNASQLVKGNNVQIGGTKVGSVKDLTVSPNGQALVKMEIKKQYAPLPDGVHATVRQASLSGIANRYVDLELPGGDTRKRKTIKNGGEIEINQTTTEVEIDQLFNTLNPPTRKALQEFFKNSAIQFHGKEAQQQLAYHYLNPALSSGSRLFAELNRDQPLLVRFLVDSSNLVTDLAQKRDDLSALIQNANETFTALGNERLALAESVARLPGFMRQANTTFVNLRAALNDVDPLVNASKPVAKKLRPFLAELRPLARNARPTVHDLANITLQRGPNNDLFDLEQSLPPVAQIALDEKKRSYNPGGGAKNVGTVRGAFPETVDALKGSAPLIAFGRPYTPDLFGWFDDFSQSGVYDAGGNVSRAWLVFNAITFTGNTPNFIPLGDRATNFTGQTRTRQYRRCPGAGEAKAPDGSNVYSASEQQAMSCTEADRAVGDLPVGP